MFGKPLTNTRHLDNIHRLAFVRESLQELIPGGFFPAMAHGALFECPPPAASVPFLKLNPFSTGRAKRQSLSVWC